MKKKILTIFSLFTTSLMLLSCSGKTDNSTTNQEVPSTSIVEPSTEPGTTEPIEIIDTFVITFFDKSYLFDQEVKINEKVILPENPTRESESENYKFEFVGWCIDEELTQLYDFETKVTSSFSLYAKYKRVAVQEDNYDPDNIEELTLHQIKNSDETVKYNLYFIIGFNQSNFDVSYSYDAETDTISFEGIKLNGYTFNGWYLDVNMINEPFDNTNTTLASLNKDTIYLYAKFTENTPTPPIEEQCVHQIETRVLQQGSCKTGVKTIEQTYCVKCGETYSTTEYTVYHEMPDKSECEHFAPTCTEKGYYVQKCKNCDYQLQYIYADEIEHNLVNKVVVEPTCTANGYSADVCTMCGTEFNRVTIEPTGHNYYAVGTIPSTCSTNGYELYQCRCGNTLEGDLLPLDENNHVYDANGVCYLCGHQREE